MGGDYTPTELSEDVLDITSLGKGIKVTSKNTVELTRKYAEAHIALPAFAGERDVRQSHVDMLLQHMQRGTFRPEWVKLMVCRCNEECRDIGQEMVKSNTRWRMNGQHTCWARLQMPEDYRCPVEVVNYTAETAYDMRMLYASIDRGAPRTRVHIMQSYLSGTPAFDGFNKACMAASASGLAHWQWGWSDNLKAAAGRDADVLAYLMQTEYYELTIRVLTFLSENHNVDRNFLLRRGVVGAMYATYGKAVADSGKFWGPVATGVGIDNVNDPRLRLRNSLVTAVVPRGSVKQRYTAEDIYRWCITAWNAFREGRSLQIVRATDKRHNPK